MKSSQARCGQADRQVRRAFMMAVSIVTTAYVAVAVLRTAYLAT